LLKIPRPLILCACIHTYSYNGEMKNKRWAEIVNASYLWPLSLGPSALELILDQLLI
jgi:hypothetical protein